MLNIRGLDKAKLLVELYNHASESGFPRDRNKITIDEARKLLEQTTKFNKIDGRHIDCKHIEVDLSSDDSFDETSYDMYNGKGLAQRIVNHMRKQEILEPQIAISYRIKDENDVLVSGTFDNIPKDAWGACIDVNVPKVEDVNDKFKINSTSFNLFVGEKITINGVLNIITLNRYPNVILYDKLKNYQNQGFKNVVLIGGYLLPLNDDDYVFSSQEEMVTFITNFSNKFKTSNTTVENEEETKITR